jgi:hypothetical protein
VSTKLKSILKIGGTALALGLILVVVLSGNGNIFQAKLGLRSAAPSCESIEAVTLPMAPLSAETGALIRIKVQPADFQGTFSVATDSGFLDDLAGQRDSFIETSEKNISFSGGEGGSTITIQAQGEGNEHCSTTIPIVAEDAISCISLQLKSTPNPLPQNESAEIEIIPTPADFNGTYLIQAESGKFQSQNADQSASGTNTQNLVTKSKSILYNGGKSGEKVSVHVLGEKNSACNGKINIL